METTAPKKPTLEIVVARQYVTMLQTAMVMDQVKGLQDDPMSLVRFKLLQDAGMSNFFALCSLVNDKTAVLAEYDRLTNMVAANQDKDTASFSLMVMQGGRPQLESFLQETDRGH